LRAQPGPSPVFEACHCERSEAISQRRQSVSEVVGPLRLLATTTLRPPASLRDCFVALRAPRNDSRGLARHPSRWKPWPKSLIAATAGFQRTSLRAIAASISRAYLRAPPHPVRLNRHSGVC